VTLQLLWEEYRADAGEQAYRYSAFCDKYRAWAKRPELLDLPRRRERHRVTHDDALGDVLQRDALRFQGGDDAGQIPAVLLWLAARGPSVVSLDHLLAARLRR
jgi:hypothetical protein